MSKKPNFNPAKGHKKYKRQNEKKEDIVIRKKKAKKELKKGTIKGLKKGEDILSKLIKDKNLNSDEIKLNLYPESPNEIPGIIETIINGISQKSNDSIKRIIFETGYGNPKKGVEIRKNACKHLINNMGYIREKSGENGTFKILDDFANRLIVYPKKENEYLKELLAEKEKELEIVSNKKQKNENKIKKRQKKYYVRNKWKKNLKYEMSADEKKKKKEAGLNSDEGSNSDENNMQYVFNMANNISNLSDKKQKKRDNELFNGIKDSQYSYRYQSDDRGKHRGNKISEFHKELIECSKSMPVIHTNLNVVENKYNKANLEIQKLKKQLNKKNQQIKKLKKNDNININDNKNNKNNKNINNNNYNNKVNSDFYKEAIKVAKYQEKQQKFREKVNIPKEKNEKKSEFYKEAMKGSKNRRKLNRIIKDGKKMEKKIQNSNTKHFGNKIAQTESAQIAKIYREHQSDKWQQMRNNENNIKFNSTKLNIKTNKLDKTKIIKKKKPILNNNINNINGGSINIKKNNNEIDVGKYIIGDEWNDNERQSFYYDFENYNKKSVINKLQVVKIDNNNIIDNSKQNKSDKKSPKKRNRKKSKKQAKIEDDSFWDMAYAEHNKMIKNENKSNNNSVKSEKNKKKSKKKTEIKKNGNNGNINIIKNKPKQKLNKKKENIEKLSKKKNVKKNIKKDDSPLPYGWEVGYDVDGRAYYIDHNTKKTTWDRPTSKKEKLINPDWILEMTGMGFEVDDCVKAIKATNYKGLSEAINHLLFVSQD